MAYKESDFEDVDYSSKGAKFNEGILQTGRMNDLQKTIHAARLRPLQFFQMDEFGQGLFGYEIIMGAAEGHLVEVYPKLDTKEETNALALRKGLHEFLEKHPIFITTVNQPAGNTQQKKKNYENWVEFRELLFNFELLTRKLYDKHKMSSPEEDESDLF